VGVQFVHGRARPRFASERRVGQQGEWRSRPAQLLRSDSRTHVQRAASRAGFAPSERSWAGATCFRVPVLRAPMEDVALPSRHRPRRRSEEECPGSVHAKARAGPRSDDPNRGVHVVVVRYEDPCASGLEPQVAGGSRRRGEILHCSRCHHERRSRPTRAIIDASGAGDSIEITPHRRLSVRLRDGVPRLPHRSVAPSLPCDRLAKRGRVRHTRSAFQARRTVPNHSNPPAPLDVSRLWG
jgi:hypothetical protein